MVWDCGCLLSGAVWGIRGVELVLASQKIRLVSVFLALSCGRSSVELLVPVSNEAFRLDKDTRSSLFFFVTCADRAWRIGVWQVQATACAGTVQG